MAGRVCPDFSIETDLLNNGMWPVAGVDEVGRGPLAGPVTAAAVILDPQNIPNGLNDSKALSPKARDAAFVNIMNSALAVGVSFLPATEIDKTNIRVAALSTMTRAVCALPLKPAYAIIDGRDIPELPCPGAAFIKGDARSLSISAASIVAKVLRDGMMRRLGEQYPAYGFETNAGYGAKRHLEAIARLGPTPFHRMSFSPLTKN